MAACTEFGSASRETFGLAAFENAEPIFKDIKAGEHRIFTDATARQCCGNSSFGGAERFRGSLADHPSEVVARYPPQRPLLFDDQQRGHNRDNDEHKQRAG